MKDSDKTLIKRRDFVKGSSAVAAGVLLTPLSVGASAWVGGSDTLKVAVVGCGGRGTGAANQALNTGDDVKLVAMADAFRDRVDSSYENLMKVHGTSGRMEVPEKNKFSGFDAYRKAIDLADVIILATPPGFRPFHFEYAIQQGKHVFMEKPVATDPYGIRKVLEAGKMAKEKNLNVVVGLQRHYQKSYNDLYNRVKQGDIGKIVSGQVYWNDAGVWVRDREPGQTEMEYQMRNWYYFTWLCGDHIVEQHIHNIDVANWFIGEYPDSAQGMGGREVRTGKNHGQIFDHHFVEFNYPGGAVIASQCRHQKGCMNRVAENLVGTNGSVSTIGGYTVKDLDGKITFRHDDTEDANPYQVEHDKLFKAIRGEGYLNDTEIGAKSTMSAILGRMATYSGKLITWEEALNSDLRLVPDMEAFSWDSEPPVVPDGNGLYPVAIPGITKVM